MVLIVLSRLRRRAPQPTASRSAAATVTVKCSSCERFFGKQAFSNSQWKRRGGGEARCSACVATGKQAVQPREKGRSVGVAAPALDCGAVGTFPNKRLRPTSWGYSQHVDALWGKACFAAIVRHRLFPRGARDISSSMGVLRAATLHCTLPMVDGVGAKQGSGNVCGMHGGATDCWQLHGFRARWNAEGVWCITLGDGCTPRTAAVVSYLTRWHAIAVGTALLPEWAASEPKGIRNLAGVRASLEDWLPAFAASAKGAVARAECKHLIVLCVHAHYRFKGEGAFDVLRTAFGTPPATLVALPCCPAYQPAQDIGREPDVTFDDPAIFSANRSIDVWNWS